MSIPVFLLAFAAAGQAAPAPAPAAQASAPAPNAPPRLTVVISVDQVSADLFAQHRAHFTGGFARLLTGAVFPSGYQSHAATETCPGHSTILTGMRPAHTGIIANDWFDPAAPRADKVVYCVEDETAPGSTHDKYVVSDRHLRVPTLGEVLKRANPASRVVSVAGKDRAAVMMGGHKVDELWWWSERAFVSYPGRAVPPVVLRANAATAALLASPQEALPLPGWCRASDVSVGVEGKPFGQGRFAHPGGDWRAFRASPAADASVFALAAGLVQEQGLGKGPAPDLLAIGASATDYVGHAFGTQGTEMCIQMAQLDEAMGAFFDQLDAMGLDYQVVLTADHGAQDLAERQQARAMPGDARLSPDIKADAMSARIAAALGVPGPVLASAESRTGVDNDVYFAPDLPPALRPRVLAEALRQYRARPEVQAVFTRADLAAVAMPTTPPETWTLAERARASFDPQRTGDLLVLFKPRLAGVARVAPYYVETHGSPWDYDRRVPIVFWRRGMTGFEQPLSVETVDIAPTLAAMLGVAMPGVDGRCLDLDPGPGDTCRR